MAINAAQVYRDYVVQGVPSSGPHKPSKPDIRTLLTGYEKLLGFGSTGAGSVAKATRSDLYADLSIGANIMAWVYADPTVEYNAIYRKIGASGTGSWEMILPLPYSFIVAVNDGTGSENAIHAVTEIPVSDAALIILGITADNTASPVTVSFNGGEPLPIKSNTGNDIAPGGLVAGMQVLGVATSTEFRIVTDQVSTAIIAQAEAASADAETYKDAALAAVPNAFPTTLAALKALPSATVKNAFLNGGQWQFKAGNFSTQIAADTVGGIYAKADDTAATAGAWVRIFDGPAYLEWFGGGPGVNNAAAFATVKALTLPWVRLKAGNYLLNSIVTMNHSFRLDGEGYGSHIDCSAGGMLKVEGSISALPDLSSNVTPDDGLLAFTAPHGLAPNDLILIFNPTSGSWFNFPGRNYMAGEFVRCYRYGPTPTTQIRPLGRLYDSYTAAAVDLYKVNAVRVVVENVRFTEATSLGGSPLYIKWGDGVRIKNVFARSTNYCAIEVDRSYDVSIEDASVLNDSPVVGDEYGISLPSCQIVSVRGGAIGASRHSIAIGSYDEVGGVPARGYKIYGLTLLNYYEAGAGDMHGCVEDIVYDNCTFRSGLNMQGQDVTVRNCEIYNMLPSSDAYCIYGTEVAGGIYTIENCKFYSKGPASAYGVVYLECPASMRKAFTLVARNNTINVDFSTATTRFFYVRGSSATKKINVLVDGLVAYSTSLQSIAIRDAISGTVSADFMKIINYVVVTSGGVLAEPA